MRRRALAAALLCTHCSTGAFVSLDVDAGDIVVAAGIDGSFVSIGVVDESGSLHMGSVELETARFFILEPMTDLITADESGSVDAFSELAASLSEDLPGCGRCLFPATTSPMVLHPGSSCQIPKDIPAVRSDGSAATDEATSLLRERLFVGWAAECGCQQPELIRDAAALTFEPLFPREDFWPAQAFAANPAGEVAVFGAQLEMLISPDGQRMGHSEDALEGEYTNATRWSGGFVTFRYVDGSWLADVLDGSLALIATSPVPLNTVKTVSYFEDDDAVFIGGDVRGDCEGNECAAIVSCRVNNGLSCAEISPPLDPLGAESYQQFARLDDGSLIAVGKEGSVLVYEHAPPPGSGRVIPLTGTLRGTVEVPGQNPIAWWGFKFPVDSAGIGPLELFGTHGIIQRGQSYHACVLAHNAEMGATFTTVLTGTVTPGERPNAPVVTECMPSAGSGLACSGFFVSDDGVTQMLHGSGLVELDPRGHAISAASGTGKCPPREELPVPGRRSLDSIRQEAGVTIGVEASNGAIVRVENADETTRLYGADGLHTFTFARADQFVLIDTSGRVSTRTLDEVRADPAGGMVEGSEPLEGLRWLFQAGDAIFAHGRSASGAWLEELDLETATWREHPWPAEIDAWEIARVAPETWLVVRVGEPITLVRDGEPIILDLSLDDPATYTSVGGAWGVGWVVGRLSGVFRVNALAEQPVVTQVSLPDRIANQIAAREPPHFRDIDSDCADGVRMASRNELETVRLIGGVLTLEALDILDNDPRRPEAARTGPFLDLTIENGRALRRFERRLELFPEDQAFDFPGKFRSATRLPDGSVLATGEKGRVLLGR